MGQAKRILLAEDDAGFRFSVRVALQRAGYRVDEAENGRDALARLIEAQLSPEPYDLLVTDIDMPSVSGLELIAEMTARHILVSVCVITGSSCNPDKWRGQAREVPPDCLEKPFSIKELLDLIDAIARKSPRNAA